MILDGYITHGLILGRPIFPLWWHWTLGVIFFGFHVIAYNVLHSMLVIIMVWCSLVFGASIMQDKDLSEYNPSGSSTSKHVNCSHELCELGLNCKSPKQPCPYIVNYYSENTSSSGLLVQDTLHLASSSDHMSQNVVQVPVIMGCGRKQSGRCLDGIAPDGVMGLGLGDISIPSFIAKTGLIRNSFSICFGDDDSGRIFFGDQGFATQQSTPFLPLEGKYITYIVGVEGCCIGNSCLHQTGFQAQIDSGSSFTFLPDEVYQKVVTEFDRQVNATRSYKGSLLDYCYEPSTSQGLLNIPAVILMFAPNNSFVVHNPTIFIYANQDVVGFCLAIQRTEGNFGVIGQNFMTGYRLVFDRENLKLGWSRSNCQDLTDGRSIPLTPPPYDRPENPLPTNEQQRTPNGRAVAPAVAGRAPVKSAASRLLGIPHCLRVRLLLLLLLLICLFVSAV
ncbi:PREDICTED: aspartic proteinase-like protein 1 isoform X2 [Nelumbo nucifera]|uniref:Aspartic proteinase-like protein 1 isoform X2 n=1 Tax=Nelumbo nucifera TaxID=4432 RepID=A0A1U8A7Z2_NELNU|nr:PREDICTED: aspartic proteinase-like protein 1 isoform X2 [Nelumbo nucifera]